MPNENFQIENQDDLFMLEDPALDALIKAHKRALSDLEEINSDPYLEETRMHVVSTMSELDTENITFESDKKFVENSLSPRALDHNDFKDIKIEIRESDIEKLSVEWVNEWHRKKQAQAGSSLKDEERKKFITDSIAEPERENAPQPKILPFRRLAYMAAAAVIGAIVLISTLTPASDPGKLFSRYYESFPAMTSITRGSKASDQINFEQGIEFYKSGRYPEAAAAFRQTSQENSASLFYLGLSELENGKIDQAISSLKLATERQTVFNKESRWYLGLAYLRKGNKAEAANCFGDLAGTEGYYSERAAKILRRLK